MQGQGQRGPTGCQGVNGGGSETSLNLSFSRVPSCDVCVRCSQPGADKPGAGKPGAGKPEAGKPGAGKPGAGKLG